MVRERTVLVFDCVAMDRDVMSEAVMSSDC